MTPGRGGRAARVGLAVGLPVTLALGLSGCDLLSEIEGRSYAACGVYPAAPIAAHGSSGRAADYYDAVLLPESTSREDRRELRREAPSSASFTFFGEDQSVTYRGRSFEYRYLIRVEDVWGEYWTHENELSGLEGFCPYDEP